MSQANPDLKGFITALKKERLFFFFQFVGFSWSHFVKIPTNGQSNCRKCIISMRQGRTHCTICLPSAFFPPSLLSPKCASESHSALKRTPFYKWLYISYNAIRKRNIWVLYGEKNVQVCIKPVHFSLQVMKHNNAVFNFIFFDIT